jgi:hypothetical protein
MHMQPPDWDCPVSSLTILLFRLLDYTTTTDSEPSQLQADGPDRCLNISVARQYNFQSQDLELEVPLYTEVLTLILSFTSGPAHAKMLAVDVSRSPHPLSPWGSSQRICLGYKNRCAQLS